MITSIGQALFTSFSMFWEILWPLLLGFTLSGIVQAVVSHHAMAKTLGCDGPKCLTFATLFGIASSSCRFPFLGRRATADAPAVRPAESGGLRHHGHGV
jgi:uncharacterized protein